MNLIVIVSDTFRYDNLAVGGGRARTPELDSFIAGANLFENYIISSFPTIPNRTDMITGRYTFPFHGWQPIDPEVPVLADLLSDPMASGGFVSQLLCDTPHLMSGKNWFHRGFTSAYQTRGQEGDKYFLRMNTPLRHVSPAHTVYHRHEFQGAYGLQDVHSWTHSEWTWEEDRYCCQTARLASKWLELNCNHDGFMLWVDMFDPHEPWDPPEYMVRWFDDSGYDGPPCIQPNYGPASAYSEAELCNVNAHYRAEASLVDKWVGHILRKIRELGLLENTAVVFTSDHGHYLGEHNWVGKLNLQDDDPRRCALYRELTHVPLIMHVPGLAGGRVFSELVQPPDLMPTLLELGGVEAPSDIHGKSLVPLLRGEGGWERKLAVSSAALEDEPAPGRAFPTVTDGRYTYTPRGERDTPELYDLAADPGELINIVTQEPQVAQVLHEGLIAFLSKVGTAERRVATLAP